MKQLMFATMGVAFWLCAGALAAQLCSLAVSVNYHGEMPLSGSEIIVLDSTNQLNYFPLDSAGRCTIPMPCYTEQRVVIRASIIRPMRTYRLDSTEHGWRDSTHRQFDIVLDTTLIAHPEYNHNSIEITLENTQAVNRFPVIITSVQFEMASQPVVYISCPYPGIQSFTYIDHHWWPPDRTLKGLIQQGAGVYIPNR